MNEYMCLSLKEVREIERKLICALAEGQGSMENIRGVVAMVSSIEDFLESAEMQRTTSREDIER